jgi:hypothetical protein
MTALACLRERDIGGNGRIWKTRLPLVERMEQIAWNDNFPWPIAGEPKLREEQALTLYVGNA